MTAKEKAYSILSYLNREIEGCSELTTRVKKSAIFMVDEIIKAAPSAPIISESGYYSDDIMESIAYWQEVKQEIEKL